MEHLFAVDVIPHQGVHEIEKDLKKDYSEFKERDRNLIKYLKKKSFIKEGYKVLDFGSGTGHLLKALLDEIPNIKIVAVEYNTEYHNNLQAIGCQVYKTLDDIPAEEKFDAITFIEVIEHLDDPMEILIKLKSRLKANHKLFLTTPAGDYRKSAEKKWELNAYITPYHVQFFTEKSLKYGLNKAGFSSLKYKYINEMYPNREYKSLNATLFKIRSYYTYFRGYTSHLTYFVS
jgi:2-polyprenyl-3-methyl-5-hydroxy-6-metoxy-1,4-benzoquinol methylase